jgi:hypothetical protein
VANDVSGPGEWGELCDPEAAERVPSLLLAMTLVGVACGWLTIGALRGPPLFGRVADMAFPLAAAIAGTWGAVLGGYLERWSRHAVVAALPPSRFAMHLLILTAGFVTALAVAALDPVRLDLNFSALAGISAALASIPVCRSVLASAQRAARARLGSLVSDTDRRMVRTTLAAALGLASLSAIPQWLTLSRLEPRASDAFADAPIAGALVVALLAAAVVFASRLGDDRALARFVALERRLGGDADAEPAPPETEARGETDLGLGRARHERRVGGSSYRDAGRTVALVRGDPALARRALEDAIARGRRFGALTALVVCAHLAALILGV